MAELKRTRAAKKVSDKPMAKAKALPSGIDTAFRADEGRKEVFISRDSGEWFFDEKRARKHFRNNYDIIKNPYIE